MENQVEKAKPSIMRMTLEKASKLDLIRSFGKLTLKQVVANKYPSIGQLEKSYEVDKAEKVTSIILTDLSSSFNDELSPDQVEEIMVEVHSTLLRNLSYEDLFLVCKEIKAAEIYGKLTINKVLKYLHAHHLKKCDMIYEANLNKHLANKEDVSDRQTAKQQYMQRMHDSEKDGAIAIDLAKAKENFLNRFKQEK